MTKKMFLITLEHHDGERRSYKVCGINADDAKTKIGVAFSSGSIISCEYLYTYED